jgi:preprotein translocase subunit SecF
MSTATLDPEPPGAKRDAWWRRLDRGETTYPFVRKARRFYIVSIVVVVVGLIALAVSGLNLGIDFKGGVAWEVPSADVSTSQVEGVLSDHGLKADKIQTLRGSGGERIRVQVGPQDAPTQNAVRQDLADLAHVDAQDISLNSVGPTWGNEITKKAVRALIVFVLLVTLYLSVRLEWRMAVAAMVAVVHDVLVTVGIYALFQWEVTPSTVIAFLTILGFSLYDTIVVFDKLHENIKRFGPAGRTTFTELTELSANETLMRSLSTSLAAVLPVLSLLIVGSVLMGAVALEDFALALLVGLVAGSYSSLFLATPIVAVLKEREPRWKAVRQRLAGRAGSGGGGLPPLAASAAGAVEGNGRARGGAGSGGSGGAGASAPPARRTPGTASLPGAGRQGGAGTIPPRPRKQKRR